MDILGAADEPEYLIVFSPRLFTCSSFFETKERNMNWRGAHLTEETPAPWLRSAATPFVYDVQYVMCIVY